MRESSPGKLTDWQLIFLQSKANGAAYNGDALERHKWEWPKETYFQRRLRLRCPRSVCVQPA